MKRLKKLMVAMMLLIVGVSASSQVVQAETAVDQEVSSIYIPPQSLPYTWNSPMDHGYSVVHRIWKDGYLYQGTLYKRGMDGWLFVYSGTLYRTPNVVPHAITE